MGIKLSWTNRGTVPLDSIRVYRATSKTGTLTLVDTIAGTALTYEDTTAPTTNIVYWYSIASVKDGSETLSKRTPIGYFPDNGPGPKNLFMGDWEFGYFGEVTTDMALLPTFDEVATAGNFSRSTADNPTKFRKWVVGGKIIYIPNGVIGSYSVPNMVTYKLIKPFNNDAAKVLSVDKGDYGFNIRVPRASTVIDSTAQVLAGDDTKLKSELCASIMGNMTFDTASENNRFFKGSGRITDEAGPYSQSGRIWVGYQDAANWFGLQWSQWSVPIATVNASAMVGNIIYELDFS